VETDSGVGREVCGALKSSEDSPIVPIGAFHRSAFHRSTMDPDIVHDKALLPDGVVCPSAEDGVKHPPRLRAQAGQDAGSLAVAAAGPAPAGGPTIMERRRSLRFQCSGSVELHEKGGVRTWGTLKDISLHGCYVEMPTTFPLDTVLTLNIESTGVRFSAEAKVRVCYPSLGMGMCFSEIKPDQQTQLGQLLSALAGHKTAANAGSVGRLGPVEGGMADAKTVVEMLTEYFHEHGSLSREEFYAIAKRARCS